MKVSMAQSESDSGDDTESQDAGEDTRRKGCRSSDRIKRKQEKTFHMPSRNDVFGKIDSDVACSGKSYSYLQPRKLVDTFSRVTHQYNYEPNETTDESLEEEFIIDDEHYYELEDKEYEERRQRKMDKERRRLAKRRLKQEKIKALRNDSSSSDDNQCKIKRIRFVTDSSDLNSEHGNVSEDSPQRDQDAEKVQTVTKQSVGRIESSDSGSDIHPCTSRCTDDKDEERRAGENGSASESDDQSRIKKRPRLNTSNLIRSSDSDSSDVAPRKKVCTNDFTRDDSGQSDKSSSSSDYSNLKKIASPSERAKVMDQRKQERRKMFDHLKERRERRLSKE